MAERTRTSRQRDQIFEVLRKTRGHPTATSIYDRVRRQFPDLSLGTVYRNLGVLVKKGLVNRLDFGGTFDRFEARILPHHHFVCEQCGGVSDLDIPVDQELTKKLRAATGLDATRHEIRLYGICEKCRRKANDRARLEKAGSTLRKQRFDT
jgi:Fur family peroxide stress response transcriptional regulator